MSHIQIVDLSVDKNSEELTLDILSNVNGGIACIIIAVGIMSVVGAASGVAAADAGL